MNSNIYTVIYCKVSTCTRRLYCHVQFCSIAMRIIVYMAFVSDRLVSGCFWDTLFFIEDVYDEIIHSVVYISLYCLGIQS
jgi:hypothetical protein